MELGSIEAEDTVMVKVFEITSKQFVDLVTLL
jgi:hypothetical protein